LPPRGVTIYLALAVLAAAVFTLFPGIDLWSSGWFYDGGFRFADEPLARFVFRAVYRISEALSILLPLALIAAAIRRRAVLGLDTRAAVYLIAALAIGPGIVVNTALKDHWGRARPSQIVEFGGAKHFTPALEPSDQCERNCSFPSGHAAIGFYFAAFAFLIPGRRARRSVLGGAIAAGLLIGLARMAQGGHFLSDVAFAGLIVIGIAGVLHWLIVRRGGIAATEGATRIALIGAVCLVAGALCFAYYDRPVALAMWNVDPRIHDAFEFITQFGLAKGWLIGAAVAFAAFMGAARYRGGERAALWRVNAWRAAFLFLGVALSGIAVDLLKLVFGRARPKLLFRDGEYGFTWHGSGADLWSFPSGHAATAAALAMALSLIWPRYWLTYWLAATLIFASRIIIDAHYLSDIIAGTYLAAAIVLALHAGFARLRLPPSSGAPSSR
jgi:lipid A 4'-phosphatase